MLLPTRLGRFSLKNFDVYVQSAGKAQPKPEQEPTTTVEQPEPETTTVATSGMDPATEQKEYSYDQQQTEQSEWDPNAYPGKLQFILFILLGFFFTINFRFCETFA